MNETTIPFKESSYNGETQYNLDLRELEYNSTLSLEILEDPFSGESPKYKQNKLVNGKMVQIPLTYCSYPRIVHNGQEGRMFVWDYAKSHVYGKSLNAMLRSFPFGTKLYITRRSGKTKQGKEFQYFQVSQTPEEVDKVYAELKAKTKNKSSQVDIVKQNTTPQTTTEQTIDIDNKVAEALKKEGILNPEAQEVKDTCEKYNANLENVKKLLSSD